VAGSFFSEPPRIGGKAAQRPWDKSGGDKAKLKKKGAPPPHFCSKPGQKNKMVGPKFQKVVGKKFGKRQKRMGPPPN